MEWIFSSEIEYKGMQVNIYFMPVQYANETIFQALSFPKGIISPFTLRYNCDHLEFKIVEEYVTDQVAKMELMFSDAILSLGDLRDINNPYKRILN